MAGGVVTATALPALSTADRHALRPALSIQSGRRDGDVDSATSTHSGCLLPGPLTGSDALLHIRGQVLEGIRNRQLLH